MAANEIRAIGKKDAEWLANYPKAIGGFVTAWGDDSNGHDLPDLIEEITGKSHLAYVPGGSGLGEPVSKEQVQEIIEKSKPFSNLKIKCMIPCEEERQFWIAKFKEMIQ
jgi:hypothetical protein